MATIEESRPNVLIIYLLGQFLECILYGIYLNTLCMWAGVISSRYRSRQSFSWVLVAVVLWIFSLGTLDVVVGVYQVIINSVYPQGGQVPLFLSIFNWSYETPNVIRVLCLMAQGIVGDGVLLYRCYVIWNRRWYTVAFPATVWLSELVCGVVAVCFWSERPDLGLDTEYTKPFVFVGLIFTLIFNLVTTSLLVYAILRVHKRTKTLLSGNQKSHLSHVSLVFIETGLAYTSCIFIVSVLYGTSSVSVLIVMPCTIQIAGIVFNLLIIRINAEVSRRSSIDPSGSLANPRGFVVAVPATDSQPCLYNPTCTKGHSELRDAVLWRPSSHTSVEIILSEEVDTASRCHYVLESAKVEGFDDGTTMDLEKKSERDQGIPRHCRTIIILL